MGARAFAPARASARASVLRAVGDTAWTPVLILTALAVALVALVALGLAGFRRRDLATK